MEMTDMDGKRLSSESGDDCTAISNTDHVRLSTAHSEKTKVFHR